VACLLVFGIAAGTAPAAGASGRDDFRIEEATIEEIQSALLRRKVTTTEIVKLYLERIKAFNGPCVNEPEGILGPISTIPHAGKLNALFVEQFPAAFPFDDAGEPVGDHIGTLVDMLFDPSLVPHNASGQPSIRNLGGGGDDTGDGRYNFNMYLRERGDAEMRSLTDLIEKANYWSDPAMPSRNLEGTDEDRTYANGATLQTRFTLQTIVHQCFAEKGLDAVVYPTGNIPPAILTAPQEPSVNDRSSGLWTYINSRGFPAMTVPAGFTTHVYDRAADGALLPAKDAELPVGIDFLGLPFSEPKLFAIAEN
jgi:amidase